MIEWNNDLVGCDTIPEEVAQTFLVLLILWLLISAKSCGKERSGVKGIFLEKNGL